ncbi:hypothetical protein [Promicromonospora sp. NPDC050880]|uniref:hypothetical protein n=1 Tax=Promicromonospora sp. NPDC050880 TaxID=3364406 RepID=UPI0037AEC33F
MGRHPAVQAVLRWFEFEHLRPGPPRDTSRMFHALAHELADRLPGDPETTVALRHLLDAKDAAVRATIAGMETPTG